MKKIYLSVIIICMTFGCSALLPSSKETTPSPWKSFNDSKAAFDKIIPYETTTDDLKQLGFDPYSTENIRILNYFDIAIALTPGSKGEIDQGIEKCIQAKSECRAYEFEPKFIKSKRYGNFWLDLFGFKRKTNISGWKFKAFIITVNGTVVYKLWGGSPAVNEESEKIKPLGPLQDIGNINIKSPI